MTRTTATSQTNGDLRTRVERVLEMIRPAIQSDGGDVELVNVDSGGQVQIRFHGACIGCPSSNMTLKIGIEENLKQNVEGVSEVVAVD